MLAVFFHIGHVSGDLSRVLFFTRKFTNVEFFIKEIFLVIVKEDFLFFYFKSPSDLFYRLFIHGSRWLGMIFIECRTSCIDSRQFFLIQNLGSVKKILLWSETAITQELMVFKGWQSFEISITLFIGTVKNIVRCFLFLGNWLRWLVVFRTFIII